MSSVRFMLADLRDWIAPRAQQLDQYIATYPYSHYKHTDTVTILRNHIQHIVSQIIALLTRNPPSHSPITLHTVEEIISPQLASILCKVRVTVENIRYAFLAIEAIKTLSSTRILRNIEECIDQLATQQQLQHLDPKRYRPRSRRQRSVDYAGTAPAGLLHRSRDQIRIRQQEQPNKVSTKAYLYEEMAQYLSQKERSSNRDRTLSDKLYVSPTLEPQKHDRAEERQNIHKKTIHSSEPQKELVGHKAKRRFRYLQEYQRQMPLKQVDCFYPTDRQWYQTPQNYQHYKSVPSTQSGSKISTNPDKLEDELPEFDQRALGLEALKRQIDFGPNISKIKHREEQGWQEQFDEDSIQKSPPAQCNLDDSLEMMKQEQMLNKTGSFNAPPSTAEELHQYSFGQE